MLIDDAFDVDPFIIEDFPYAAYYPKDDEEVIVLGDQGYGWYPWWQPFYVWQPTPPAGTSFVHRVPTPPLDPKKRRKRKYAKLTAIPGPFRWDRVGPIVPPLPKAQEQQVVLPPVSPFTPEKLLGLQRRIFQRPTRMLPIQGPTILSPIQRQILTRVWPQANTAALEAEELQQQILWLLTLIDEDC